MPQTRSLGAAGLRWCLGSLHALSKGVGRWSHPSLAELSSSQRVCRGGRQPLPNVDPGLERATVRHPQGDSLLGLSEPAVRGEGSSRGEGCGCWEKRCRAAPKGEQPSPGSVPPLGMGTPPGSGQPAAPAQPQPAQTPGSAGLTLPAPRGSAPAKATQEHGSGPLETHPSPRVSTWLSSSEGMRSSSSSELNSPFFLPTAPPCRLHSTGWGEHTKANSLGKVHG